MGLLGLIPFLIAGTLGAQDTQLTLEAGTAAFGQDGLGGRLVGFLNGGYRRAGERFALSASGALSMGTEGTPAVFANAGLDFAPLAMSWWHSELSASITQASSDVGVSATARSVRARQSAAIGPLSLWASGGLGDTQRTELASNNSLLSVGASLSRSCASLSIEGRQWRTVDYTLVEAAGYRLSRPASAYDLRDAVVTAHLRLAPIEWIVSGAWRRGAQATIGASRALSLGVQADVGARVALALFAGEQLADPLRGVPESRMVSASLRWRWSLGEQASVRPAFEALGLALVERDAAGVTTLSLEVGAPPDARVEYSTSFTDWTPVPLARDGTRFHARLVLPPGTHRVAVRVNGGPWQPPAGMARVDDDLGGAAGLLVVP